MIGSEVAKIIVVNCSLFHSGLNELSKPITLAAAGLAIDVPAHELYALFSLLGLFCITVLKISSPGEAKSTVSW